METFPKEETIIILQGPAGDLEILATPNEHAKATAIICHPHPLYGGTMYNKVVTTLAKAFFNLNLRTIRFNFRGIGQSSGKHDKGNGETEDTIFLAQWIKTLFPKEDLWLAGFSFGAYVAAKASTQMQVKQLITIAPQVSRFIETKLPPILCPWLLVQGEQDDVVSPEAVFEWIETLHPQPRLIRFPNAGHFFHGQLTELRKRLEEELSS